MWYSNSPWNSVKDYRKQYDDQNRRGYKYYDDLDDVPEINKYIDLLPVKLHGERIYMCREDIEELETLFSEECKYNL